MGVALKPESIPSQSNAKHRTPPPPFPPLSLPLPIPGDCSARPGVICRGVVWGMVVGDRLGARLRRARENLSFFSE